MPSKDGSRDQSKPVREGQEDRSEANVIAVSAGAVSNVIDIAVQ
jgi:hypothetical protein